MSDFDYTIYPDETLRNVIVSRAWDLKDRKRSIKLLEQKLAGRRGYSHEQLDNMAFHLRTDYKMILMIEAEIEDCENELHRRAELLELWTGTRRSLHV